MAFRYRRCRLRRLVFGCPILLTTSFALYYTLFVLELWPWNPMVDHWCERERVPDYMLQPEFDEMTIVTMFLDLGVFKKGEERFAYHSPYKYRKWMRVFGRLANRVVAYIENNEDINLFKEIRSCLPTSLTKIIKVDRANLPSFSHLPVINKIYSQQSYPKYYPNTIYPEYTCAMHAKYDVLEWAATENYLKTQYFAWLDIGYFRNLDSADSPVFKLVPPEEFDHDGIGFSQVRARNARLSPEIVMKGKKVWLSGGLVLGSQKHITNFVLDYKQAVSQLLDQGLSNTDQEVINAMYTAKMRQPRYVKVNTYECSDGQFGLYGADARYFCLGFTCKDAWEKRVKVRSVKN